MNPPEVLARGMVVENSAQPGFGRCDKCGQIWNHAVRYNKPKDELVVKCERCGHRWTKPPLDREPT